MNTSGPRPNLVQLEDEILGFENSQGRVVKKC